MLLYHCKRVKVEILWFFPTEVHATSLWDLGSFLRWWCLRAIPVLVCRAGPLSSGFTHRGCSLTQSRCQLRAPSQGPPDGLVGGWTWKMNWVLSPAAFLRETGCAVYRSNTSGCWVSESLFTRSPLSKQAFGCISHTIQIEKKGEHFMVNTRFKGKQTCWAIQRSSVLHTELRPFSFQHMCKFSESFRFCFGCLSLNINTSVSEKLTTPHPEVSLCGSEGFLSCKCRLQVFLLKLDC